MIHPHIQALKNEWYSSKDCPMQGFMAYIRTRAQLRDTQIDAIETYLFLKIQGQNKPLWQLFSEGFFTSNLDLATLNINQTARDFLSNHAAALALYQFASQSINGKPQLPELQKNIIDAPHSIEYERIIKELFYGVNYADYLMSLPMGAGKTYLMAALIYIDLYFANNEPTNPAFAHNFLILIPNGLKNSIAPSLKTIANFDPSWVLPEPSASQIKSLLKFDVLDVGKSAKKSNTARNPNAQKVNACLPSPFGQVFVVNAEKVVLESFNEQQLELEHTNTPNTRNELKHLFGKIPHLSLLIDEVHHVTKDDIKLRQAVNYWHAQGNITTVLGFSGTPYLQKAETIQLGDYTAKFLQITNTVYYYPLKSAIERFLKKPTVKVAHQLERLSIIEQGIEDFKQTYGHIQYNDGCIPKIAIYCSSIAALEEEVYPHLIGQLRIHPDEILKYHGGNASYSLPIENEQQFRTLDLPSNPKRYILLVQVGKEGWDCRTLAGVILSQKGDSPTNMVLQTACRCLREMDKNHNDTALIWLNKDNADTLNKQLKQEQNTSIDEINAIAREHNEPLITRLPRVAQLNLPSIPFKQLRVNYQHIHAEDTPNTAQKLSVIHNNLAQYHSVAIVGSSSIDQIDHGNLHILDAFGDTACTFTHWLFNLAKNSLGRVTLGDMQAHTATLRPIFNAITYSKNAQTHLNAQYNHSAIDNDIRLAFAIKRSLTTTTETVPQEAQLLLVDKLKPVANHNKLYPSQAEVDKITQADASGHAPVNNDADNQQKYQAARAALEAIGMAHTLPPIEQFLATQNNSAGIVAQKQRSFHYLPYDFKQSGFERDILDAILRESTLTSLDLEIYYNGERGLTEFVIDCFKQRGRHWQKIGTYTPDFLVIRRNAHNAIEKALIIETKGAGFAANFQDTREFMQGAFLETNPQFDFLYLEDSAELMVNLNTFKTRAQQFFAKHT